MASYNHWIDERGFYSLSCQLQCNHRNRPDGTIPFGSYLPAYCSHSLRPLNNYPFSVLKATDPKELEQLAILTDSTPVDKVNVVRAYSNTH